MTRAMYETLPLAELKAIAKTRRMKGCSTLRKDSLIDRMLEQDELDAKASAAESVKANLTTAADSKSVEMAVIEDTIPAEAPADADIKTEKSASDSIKSVSIDNYAQADAEEKELQHAEKETASENEKKSEKQLKKKKQISASPRNKQPPPGV